MKQSSESKELALQAIAMQATTTQVYKTQRTTMHASPAQATTEKAFATQVSKTRKRKYPERQAKTTHVLTVLADGESFVHEILKK